MTADEIKARLRGVVVQVLRVLPPDQREKVAGKIYIAGGAIVSLVLGETPVDYDIFVDDVETADRFRNAAGLAVNVSSEVLARTENAITWKLATGEVVQVVTRFTGPPSRVFDSFDYSHCKCYYRPAHYLGAVQEEVAAELVYDPELIKQKSLHYDGIKDEFALNTLKRGFKFASRGWLTDNESVINLYRTIQKSPSIDEPAERRKQTIGFYGSSLT